MFESELTAAKLVLTDLQSIYDFFSQPEQADLLRKGGLRGEPSDAIHEELKPLKLLARIIGANHAPSVKDDIEYFFERWGEDGLYVIKSAVKLNPSLSKSERKENYAFIMKIFTKQQNTVEKITGAISNLFRSADLMLRSTAAPAAGAKGIVKKKKVKKAIKLSSYFSR